MLSDEIFYKFVGFLFLHTIDIVCGKGYNERNKYKSEVHK